MRFPRKVRLRRQLEMSSKELHLVAKLRKVIDHMKIRRNRQQYQRKIEDFCVTETKEKEGC
jgi:hypothetical protein